MAVRAPSLAVQVPRWSARAQSLGVQVPRRAARALRGRETAQGSGTTTPRLPRAARSRPLPAPPGRRLVAGAPSGSPGASARAAAAAGCRLRAAEPSWPVSRGHADRPFLTPERRRLRGLRVRVRSAGSGMRGPARGAGLPVTEAASCPPSRVPGPVSRVARQVAGLPSGPGVSGSAGRRPVPRTLGHGGARGPARGGPAGAVLSAAWRGPAGPWNPGSAEPWAPLRWRGPRGAPGARAPFGCPVARDAQPVRSAAGTPPPCAYWKHS